MTALANRLWTTGLSQEHGFQPLSIEGQLPQALKGTLVRNGPGLFASFGTRYSHPFEGDGALTAVRLVGGAAYGAVRITESAALREERARGRALYGTPAPWLRRVRNVLRGQDKNPANTSVLSWQGRLLALNEGARPTEIDPWDLSTIGETTLGVIEGAFSAHPHRVASRRTTYGFGLTYGRNARLSLYALPDEGSPRRLGVIELMGVPMIHDFIATESHLVFFLSPIRCNLPRLFAGGGLGGSFEWRPQLGTEVICVPIDRPDAPVRFTVDAFHQWHFTNAYDRGDELIVEYVRYPDFASFGALTCREGEVLEGAFDAARYHRARVNPTRKTLRSEEVCDGAFDFPKVHPAKEGTEHSIAWLACADLGGIARLHVGRGEVTTLRLPSTERVAEPVFVPSGASESSGHLLVLCADNSRDQSFLAIYDAERFLDGPVVKIWFEHLIPITFHGAWIPAA
jgi:all-trans-8'-apo-beta-carotenal 15,15'-oxygenase